MAVSMFFVGEPMSPRRRKGETKFRCHTTERLNLDVRTFVASHAVRTTVRHTSSNPFSRTFINIAGRSTLSPSCQKKRLFLPRSVWITSLLGATLTACSIDQALFIRSMFSFSFYICSPCYSFLFYFSLLARRRVPLTIAHVDAVQ